jgi:hypothetical protein
VTGGYDSWGISTPKPVGRLLSFCKSEQFCTDMGNTLHSILIRLVAYVAVVITAGLLFLAGATIYELMWPRPVVPFSQMSRP